MVNNLSRYSNEELPGGVKKFTEIITKGHYEAGYHLGVKEGLVKGLGIGLIIGAVFTLGTLWTFDYSNKMNVSETKVETRTQSFAQSNLQTKLKSEELK